MVGNTKFKTQHLGSRVKWMDLSEFEGNLVYILDQPESYRVRASLKMPKK